MRACMDFGPHASRHSPITANRRSTNASVLKRDALATSRTLAGAVQTYALTRFVILRLLGLVYLCAFLVFVQQGPPLIGEHGLLPADLYLQELRDSGESVFFAAPSVFLISTHDSFMLAVGWLGAALSLCVLLGCTNAVVMALLWMLYLSIDRVGQTFWGFGWENQLLETGFLAIFLCPLKSLTPLPRSAPPFAVIFLYRWLAFRIFFGAGLIKLRGDPCWTELTCLDTHFETQPIPSPLTPFFHYLPQWAHKAGVVFNHLAELVAPFGMFGPRAVRHVAGALCIAFQATLILSGNLSFLNWLTVIPLLACLDDGFFAFLLPQRLCAPLALAQQEPTPRVHRVVAGVLVGVIALLSLQVSANLLSTHQKMNATFDPFSLVNTYGAFGSVGRVRNELVVEGSADGETWQEYEFICKPTDPLRRPCWMSPFHFRLDWQIWFAAMAEPDDEPWLVHFVWKLLHNDPRALSLIAKNPFEGAPPRFVRIRLFRYHLNRYGADAWWTREELGEWLPPLEADDERLQRYLAQFGWLR
jgi:hypothetical protein